MNQAVIEATRSFCETILCELPQKAANLGEYFYGFKVHMIATTAKEPVSCFISFGKVSDVNVAYKLIPTLPSDSTGIGDKGYVSSKLETLAKRFNINFTPIYRNNQNKNENF